VTVAFYISGHGFGHASRQIEIINALARRKASVGILIRTSAPRLLFERTVIPPFELDPRPCDTGVVQIDSLHLDPAATIARAAEFCATMDVRAAEEASLLRDRDVRLVVSDAPPLGCAGAAAAGIPSVVASNFTWDWIYQEYAEHVTSAPDLIRTIQAAYRRADAAWRLPMHGGFETFERIAEIPFVARHARADRTPGDVRRELGLPRDRRLALVSFGGYGVDDLPLDTLDCLQEWTIVMTGESADTSGPVHTVREQGIYDRGLRYQDLVSAVDAVITKPGYGIISECIANDTGIVYTSRGRFAEYAVLVREMPKYLRSVYLDQESLLAGRWLAALESVVSAPAPPERPPTNGAEVVADMIAACLHADAFSGRPPQA
jgi:hypothetical protein